MLRACLLYIETSEDINIYINTIYLYMSINFPYMLTKYISYGRRIIGITIDMILIVIPNGKIKNLYTLFSSILDILPFIQIIHKTTIKYDKSSTAYVKLTKGSPNKCTKG